jgi:ribonuclease J
MPTDKLRIIPLGGLGEIGMNCLVLEWQDQIVLMDCGLQFPDASYTGVELLLPDMSYLLQRLKNIKGVVVTHGHDDHIGAIPFLLREVELDVYATPFPTGLLTQKLTEHKNLKEIRFHEIVPREKFKVGPFTFDPISVQHSIIEALGFGIETPVGNLVHTGDFKHDSNEIGGQVIGFEPFAEWGEKGVKLLLSDSTNAERAGHTISEVSVTSSFEGIFSRQSGRIIIALFASNIRRVENLLWTAKAQTKKVALCGRSMLSYTRLAHEQDSFKIPEDTLIMLEDINRYPDESVIILATGSQAEPQSALVRVSQGIHKDLKIKPGDLIILSSRFIPGNERAITSMIDHLYRQEAEVLYEAIHQIHVSGHGFQDELMMMLKAVKPQFFTPIHGEYRHLKKHASLAKQSGVKPENINVIEDGQVLEIDEEGISLGEKLELEKIAVMEMALLESDAQTFSQRNSLAKSGVVFAVLIRDVKSKRLIAEPYVNFHGLIFRKGFDPEDAHHDALELCYDLQEEAGKKPEFVETIRLEMRRFFKKRVSHKPLVIPLVLDV